MARTHSSGSIQKVKSSSSSTTTRPIRVSKTSPRRSPLPKASKKRIGQQLIFTMKSPRVTSLLGHGMLRSCQSPMLKPTALTSTILPRFGLTAITLSRRLENSFLTRTQRTTMLKRNSLLSPQPTWSQVSNHPTTRCFKAVLSTILTPTVTDWVPTMTRSRSTAHIALQWVTITLVMAS